MNLIAVYTTVATSEQALEIARLVIEQNLAACVQSELIYSTYRWQGDIVQAPEYHLVFKTTADQYPALEQWLQQVHPYELPAIYALPVHTAAQAYADWVIAETHP